MELKEQVVLVTGGSRGLGEAIVRQFADEGAQVVINYFSSKERAESIAESLGANRAIAIQADVRDAKSVEAMFARAKEYFKKPITTIVNNALIDFSFNGDDRKKLDTIGWEDYQTQLQGSVQAVLHTMQAGREDMVAQKFGRIISIGTNLVQNPVVPYHDYNTAKSALIGMTRSLAKELGANGISVNMVSGGLLRTTDASKATPDVVFDVIEESTPLQKVTTPEDVAKTVLFFASPWADAVTGQNLIVDGGLVMQ
ncbi:3-oxoacyl-ACP reductase [Pseudogracilibacillus sp. ICA-222130]|uniref:3-oxoacyl-ACP reductase n=1 Tax=Pseudogracilibacillus sp. ICA-222130 TaxID=3134655 RepID=UPI0030C0C165